MGGTSAMADVLAGPGLKKELDEMEGSIRFLVDRMPSHADYLSRYCPAAA